MRFGARHYDDRYLSSGNVRRRYYYLERMDEERYCLLEAMRIAFPHGFITPFAELITTLGGLVEQCLEQVFPDYFDAVIGQWEHTWKNWITFHNHFTKDNITFMLTLREYHIALMVSRHIPYAEMPSNTIYRLEGSRTLCWIFMESCLYPTETSFQNTYFRAKNVTFEGEKSLFKV